MTSLDLRTGEASLRGDWVVDGDVIHVAIRLLAPRSCAHGALWELDLDGVQGRADIQFGFDGDHLLGNVEQVYESMASTIHGRVVTGKRSRCIEMGLRWTCEGARQEGVDCGASKCTVSLVSTSARVRLCVLYACHGGTEMHGWPEVVADLNALEYGLKDGSLRRVNDEIWRSLWRDALDVADLPLSIVDQRFLLAQQYYLLASYDGSSHPVAPLGLSGNQWQGCHLWDADLWHGRALAIFWPHLARQLVRARVAMLPLARARAVEQGYCGARLPWMGDEEGDDLTPSGPYREEIHVNAWAMLLVRDVWRATKDIAVLEEGWPLLEQIAEFWCSRCSLDSSGKWHLLQVLGPDEAVHEDPRNPQLVDDHFTTNVAVREAMCAAIEAGSVLGRRVSPTWQSLADSIYIPMPEGNGVILEYPGYGGHKIKQADVILSFYPLDQRYEYDVIDCNVRYYQGKIASGPLMTEQIEAAILLRGGRYDCGRVLADLIRSYRRYVHGSFEVPYETTYNSNSVMVTACGGLIGALACSWWRFRCPGDDPTLLPRLGAE
ncbi:MAG: hypothetical protein L6R48_07330 [Planctomycetes bacterium]|nr:hypothetical protein [Planctomycetota bacterium]